MGRWAFLLTRNSHFAQPPGGPLSRLKREMKMKEIWQILEKDIHCDQFTRKECIVYGILVPLAFVAIAVIAGSIE